MVLLDAIFLLMKKRPVYAKLLEGEYFDTGSKIGWLEANLRFALNRPDLKDDMRALLKRLKWLDDRSHNVQRAMYNV